MKKKVLLVLLLGLLHYSNCHSQILQFLKKADQIEISAGPSWVTLKSKDYKGHNPMLKIGYSAKLGLDYRINKLMNLNIGILYERKGTKNRDNGYYYDPSKDSTNCKCTTSLGIIIDDVSRDYLELAIASKFKINERLYVGLGVFSGYLVQVNVVTTSLWNNSKSQYRSIDPSSNRIDGGINLSVGYLFKIGNRNSFGISVNEFFGVVDISKSPPSGNTTNSLSLQIGYILKTKTA